MGNSGVKVVDCCSKPVEKIGEFCKDGEFVKMENNFVKMENNFVKMENLASELFSRGSTNKLLKSTYV
jgi:hypothetical protein